MKIAMLFPGYKSQYIGMGKDLYDEYRVIQEYFEEAYNCLNINFVKLCFASSDQELKKIDNAYLSIFLISCAISGLLKENGIEPDAVAGYDTGQLAAIYAAGGITFPDGLYLLKKYATFYLELLEANKFDLLKVNGLTTTKLEEFLDKRISIGIYQDRTQHIVTGEKEGIEDLQEKLRKASAATLYEKEVGLGLNSQLMDAVVDQINIYLEKVDFKDLKVPLIANTDAKLITKGDKVKDEFIKAINSPVRWDKVLNKLSDYDLIIQVGPGVSIKNLVAEKYSDKQVVTVNTIADLENVKKFIAESKTE